MQTANVHWASKEIKMTQDKAIRKKKGKTVKDEEGNPSSTSVLIC